MVARLIPDGPLHTGDAAAAVVIGLAVGLLLHRHRRAWAVTVVVVAWAVARGRYGAVVADGIDAQGSELLAVLAVGATAIAGSFRPWRALVIGPAALASLVGVWAVVPDTEAPLIAGGVLAGALVGPVLAGRSFPATRLNGLVLVLPVAAALAGATGRPARVFPALGVGGLCAALAVAAIAVAAQLRGRAGMPMTVSPGATSSTTTAPAPTTAP